jgi:HAE1 family hydrophobic/amphiphilic exporter-1
MKSLIRWAIANSPAMNSFVICAMVVGAVCLIVMRREVFPDFELDVALVTVPYPGATPAECETGICQVIEESVSGVDGIKKVTSVAREGFGYVIMELDRAVNKESVLTDIRDEVSNVRRRFPENIEEPEVKTITFRTTAIRVALMAPEGAEESMPPDLLELQLRGLADQIRDELLVQDAAPAENMFRELFKSWIVPAGKPVISTVEIMGAKPYQISVEIEEDKLRQYGLTLEQVAGIIRNENLELPAGKIRSDSQEVLIRGDNKRRLGSEIEKLQILNRDTGDPVRLGEIAQTIDGFDEFSLQQHVNGRPALVLNINRASNEDLFTVVNAVRQYVAEKELPNGYELHMWGDMSVDVRDRIDLLMRNGLQGLLCVFIVLALFLELRLAFWVALGIPISMLGAGIVLLGADQTLNMLSMFSFLMALGIVVDDAIVIGENVYHKREMGMGFTEAAVEGTAEVIPAVTSSIATTVIAFVPLMYVSGVMGKFIAVMPLAVIAMLVISLVESVFVLPCHLAHHRNLFLSIIGSVLYVFRPLTLLLEAIRHRCDAGVKWFIEYVYSPALVGCLRYPEIGISAATALLIFMVGLVAGGHIPFTGFPNLDSQVVEASVAFPDGTSEDFARAAAEQIESGLQKAVAELESAGSGTMVRTVLRRLGETGNELRGPNGISSGSHVANVLVELTPVGERGKTSEELLNAWRKHVGTIPGSEALRFGAQAMGPPGDAIEFKLLCKSQHADLMEKYAERCKEHLNTFEGVYDVDDDQKPGKEEIQFTVNAVGKSLGITENAVYSAIRSAYYGVEVMRMQRGRDEVRLMVRLPEDERRTFASFDELLVSDAEGNKRPLTEITDAKLSRSAAEINRVNRLRSITLSASVDAAIPGLASKVTGDLQSKDGFLDQLKADFQAETGEQLVVSWEGAQQQNAESFTSMFSGLIIALLAMYALLTMQFRSYLQPAIIMAIIPFGYIGAVFGHGILQIELTLFSFFGLVALTGVIVNDSIVLVDFMNRFLADGGSLQDAVVEAGKRRFRAVMLTSATTIAGLFPMLLETSFQAQVLIPMAASLSFGLLFGTGMILFLVPTFYLLLARMFVETDLDDLPTARSEEPTPISASETPEPPMAPMAT